MTTLLSLLLAGPFALVAGYLFPGSDTGSADEALPSWATGILGAVLAGLFLWLAVVVVLAATGTATEIVRAPVAIVRSTVGLGKAAIGLVASVFSVVGL